MSNQILDLTKDVKWIGVLDPDLVTFDIVMETKYGTTYNAYFINAEKKAIIETVKEPFAEEFIAKIRQLCDPAEIAYIVCNHTEPDHSGALKHLLKIAPNATVVGSGQALNYLTEIVGGPFKSQKVMDGDTLDLGNKTLKFIGAPNLHWPDTIYTYLEQDKILFTCDSFGAHFSHPAMYDDQVGDFSDAFKYYFDVILKPFSKFMLRAIEKIRPLDISVIATGHGPILRNSWREKVDLSEKYARQYLEETEKHPTKNVFIAYVSAYGYTAKMAEMIAEGIRMVSNFNVEVADIEHMLIGEMEERLAKSDALLVGSPTINQNTLLPIYKLFSVVNPIRDRGKLAAAFGSYGWSGEAPGLIENHLKNLKFKIFCEGVKAKFFPYDEKGQKFIELGQAFAAELQRIPQETE
ncbi:MAG TPA: FprA family A-type flavoprotein [Bacteroidales bacterium]|nr:FprA family A-type flavoprotein [Bacteroidales bacterium]HOK98359.1 FprA family A-type flavoprotein [Bacteroidales bacterium]HPO65226.1 FprA family A-type flavoprotein [Bacteroidales bacterium]